MEGALEPLQLTDPVLQFPLFRPCNVKQVIEMAILRAAMCIVTMVVFLTVRRIAVIMPMILLVLANVVVDLFVGRSSVSVRLATIAIGVSARRFVLRSRILSAISFLASVVSVTAVASSIWGETSSPVSVVAASIVSAGAWSVVVSRVRTAKV
jgi:hypothetical protein